jgi:hypothetical protein
VAQRPQRIGISTDVRHCVEAFSDCYTSCTETLTYCLDVGGALADPEHLRLLIDCAEICQTGQNTLLRGSGLSQLLATVGAEACEKCADSCRALDGSDEQLESCAEMCLHCAGTCRELVL